MYVHSVHDLHVLVQCTCMYIAYIAILYRGVPSLFRTTLSHSSSFPKFRVDPDYWLSQLQEANWLTTEEYHVQLQLDVNS